MERDERPYPYRSKIGAVLASTALLVSCSGDNKTDTNKTEPTPDQSTEQVAPSISITDEDLYCNHTLRRSDYAPTQKGTVVVDGRCDSAPEAPVGIYNHATQAQRAIASAKTGAVLVAKCFEIGQPIQNIAGEPRPGDVLRDRWILVDLAPTYPAVSKIKRIAPAVENETPFIPAAWVQGADAIKNEC